MPPQRVPITRPSTAVNPIVLATLRPSLTAQRLAPLPRCAKTTRRWRVRARVPGSGDQIFVGKTMKAVTPHAFLRKRRGRAKVWARPVGCGGRPCRNRRLGAFVAPLHDRSVSAPDCVADAAAPAAKALPTVRECPRSLSPGDRNRRRHGRPDVRNQPLPTRLAGRGWRDDFAHRGVMIEAVFWKFAFVETRAVGVDDF